MEIRRLTADELEALWALRLEALKQSPEAFGTTYEEALAGGNGHLLALLRATGPDAFYLGAVEGGRLIGMVRFERFEGAKDRHKGEVASLFIPPEHRGNGVARALMLGVIERARQLTGLEQVLLAVVTSNEAASALYRSLGFAVYGTTPRALKDGERYWDEDLMLLRL